MAVPAVEVAEEVAAAIATATGFTLTRRTAPMLDRDELVDGKWLWFAAGDATTLKAREIDNEVITVDIAYEQALPDASDEYPDPKENHPWINARLELVEQIKSLFRVSGALRRARFLGLRYQGLNNTPIYQPDLLVDDLIFASRVRLEFAGEYEPGD